MYVRNCWYVAAWDNELAADQLISRKIINEPIVLYRDEDGGLVALEDRCCHRFAPLSMGQREGNDLRCLYHGLKFNRAGACIEIPGQDRIPPQARVKSYVAIERHSWIWVWMGNPAEADPELIPPAVGFADPKWTLRSGQLDYEANYLLMNDNLTDFSHLSYVHRNSFGATEIFARTRPKLTRLDRGIRVERWIVDGFKSDGNLAGTLGRIGDVAVWQSYDYLAPGILLMLTANYAVDQVPVDQGPPTAEPISAHFTSQAVTPMSDSAARYFFSWGPLAGEGSDAQADAMLNIAHMAFNEDKQIIEAQQRIINSMPPAKEILTSADAGPVMMRGVIERLVAAEEGRVQPRSAVA